MAAPAFLPASWEAPPGVRAFTTLRHGLGISAPPFDHFNLGASRGDAGDTAAAVAGNRALLAEHGGLPCAPHWLRQVHGTHVASCQGAPAGHEPEADAAVTSAPGTVLAVLSADCLPVLFCADDASEVAAAHAGWRGLAAGVLEATVAAMRTPAPRLRAWLGPAAGPLAYEVGAEVRQALLDGDPAAAGAFVPTRPGHWRVDLPALARRRLAALGLTRVCGGEHCTISDADRFYSHRRDGRTGRMASLIWIERA